MMSRDPKRSSHAKAFINIAAEVLGNEKGGELCNLYGLSEGMRDTDALQRMCLFESDIGFFFAALSMCEAHLVPKTYFQIFDVPNPFDGPLREQGDFATHTFDITTLLGGYDEALLPRGYGEVISGWRDKILDIVGDGTAPCGGYAASGRALVVGREGVREVDKGE